MNIKRVANKQIGSVLLIISTIISFIFAGIPATMAASFTDVETATGNSFQAWSASLWTQTTQADFEDGVRVQVDTSSSAGNVLLARQSTAGVIASDTFETGTWPNTGSGWLGGWTTSGEAARVTTGTPYSPTRHLRLRSSTGYARRAVNLSGRTNVHLQFWAKANSFEGSEYAICQVSSDGSIWNTVKTWVNGIDDDNIYHYRDIDLSGYTMSSSFYVVFDAQMADTSDYLYIDNLQFATVAAYYTSGTVASQVQDTGIAGAAWDGLFWDETLTSNTDITFEVRASDASFNAGDANPPWNAAGGTSPVVSGLPSGRYMQWRATLTTTNTANTPTLQEVRVYYY